MSRTPSALVALATLLTATVAQAVELRITVQNLAPANSVATAPLRFGFGSGVFDSFNDGEAALLLGQSDIADAPIVRIAEGGDGVNWFPAFESADPTADLGSLLGPTIAPFLPGQSTSGVFDIAPANRYFSFATMVVPSNDFFLSNDDPMAYEVLDASGALLLNSITLAASDVWDAGSETEDPANAAFLVAGVNANRIAENGVVHRNFSELAAFDGLETAAGYFFDHDLLASDTPLLQISFEVVPEPATLALGTLAAALAAGWRRR